MEKCCKNVKEHVEKNIPIYVKRIFMFHFCDIFVVNRGIT